jgi:hypothetical protein
LEKWLKSNNLYLTKKVSGKVDHVKQLQSYGYGTWKSGSSRITYYLMKMEFGKFAQVKKRTILLREVAQVE